MRGDPTDNPGAIEIAPGRFVAPWLVLGIVLIGQFMVVLDASIVNVALPSIQRDLHFSSSNLQWVINAYTLTFAGFLLLGGRAADLFGRRRIFLVGLAVFTLSSLLGGLAQSEACWSAHGPCRGWAPPSWPRHAHHPDGDVRRGPCPRPGPRGLERGVRRGRLGRSTSSAAS